MGAEPGCGQGERVTSFHQGVSAASMSVAGLGMGSSEPQVKETGSGSGALARGEAACLESGVSGLLGTSGERLAWGETSVRIALAAIPVHYSGAAGALQEASTLQD